MIKCDAQRFIDILLSAISLAFLFPLFLTIAIILRCTGEGHVFYRQTRIGRSGKKFYLLKFATMLKDSPNIKTGTITVSNDPRVLPVGKFLRSSKINELPQLINVLLGEMSLIGPRPLTEETFSHYPNELQSSILSVKPGLSGVGSLVFRDEEKYINDPATAKEIYVTQIAPFKAECEIWFIRNNNLKNYFFLIYLTLNIIFTKNSSILWRFFPDMPEPSNFLKEKMY